MKITIENTNINTHYSSKRIASVETENDDLDIFDMIDEIKNVLVAYGYHSKSVEDGIIEKAHEIENDYNIEQEDRRKFSEESHN